MTKSIITVVAIFVIGVAIGAMIVGLAWAIST